MKATFVDLRKRSAEIIRALDRNEEVVLHYRGRPRALIQPLSPQAEKGPRKVEDHPAFGMWKDRADMADVSAYVRGLRRGRLNDL